MAKQTEETIMQVLKTVEGIYRNGTIELASMPYGVPEIARVLVTFLDSPGVNLRERGIDEVQAVELRARLATFAEDWESLEMDVYDDYEVSSRYPGTAVQDPMKFHVGLLGWPLGHSISPAIHNAAFAALGLAGHYELLPTPPEQIEAAVRGLAERGFRGSNVTIPHKQAVMPLMDELSEAAQLIGAVNTIIVERFSKLFSVHASEDDLENRRTILRGDNTDWLGFLHPLDQRGFDLAGQRVLLLGAGGSARAVVYALLQRGIAHLAIWNRHPARAANLAHHAAVLSPSLTITHSPFTIHHFSPHLIINTTPLGMWPNVDSSPWPANLRFPAGALVYDLVYRPERTRLLRQAEAAGCATQGGLEMLVVQGAASFELWTGQAAPLDVMMAAARVKLLD